MALSLVYNLMTGGTLEGGITILVIMNRNPNFT